MNDNDTPVQDEKDFLWTVVDNRTGLDITTQFEVNLLLASHKELMGFYHQLIYYAQINILNFVKTQEIATLCGVTEKTFKTHREELEKLGVITVITNNRRKEIRFNNVSRIPKFELPTSQLQWLPYIEKIKSSLVAYTPQYFAEEQKKQSDQQAKIKVDAIIQETLKKERAKAREKAKREEQRFPNEDYDIVLTAYKKYKGVGLLGPEVVRAKRAIKQMFLAQRSIKQIVDCMKFFHDNQRNEEMRWLQSWTLETVMKKMPEFVAGKLKVRTMDDDYEDA